jgi:hypothetical protein
LIIVFIIVLLMYFINRLRIIICSLNYKQKESPGFRGFFFYTPFRLF